MLKYDEFDYDLKSQRLEYIEDYMMKFQYTWRALTPLECKNLYELHRVLMLFFVTCIKYVFNRHHHKKSVIAILIFRKV